MQAAVAPADDAADLLMGGGSPAPPAYETTADDLMAGLGGDTAVELAPAAADAAVDASVCVSFRHATARAAAKLSESYG